MTGLPQSMPFDSVRVIDQSMYTEQPATTNIQDPIAFIPFVSPRGVGEDEKLVWLNNTSQYGRPNIFKCGLSMYLANQYLSAGGTVLGMRVRAENSTLANLVVVAKYKRVLDNPVLNENGDELYLTPEGEETTESEGNDAIVRDVLMTKLETLSFTAEKAYDKQKLRSEMESLRDDTEDEDGWKTIPLFTVHSLASGDFANNIRVRFSFDPAMEPDNPDNRFYRLTVSEAGNTLGNPMTFTFDDDYIDNGVSMTPDEVVDQFSNDIGFIMSNHFDDFKTEVASFGLDSQKDEDINQMDLLFGLTKDSAHHYKYILDEDSVALSNVNGLLLNGGSDGDFSPLNSDRFHKIDERLIKVYGGKVTDLIYDQVRYPFMHIFNPSDNIELLEAMEDLIGKRHMTIFPLAMPIVNTYTQARALRTSSLKFNNYKIPIYCESALVRDQFTGKKVRMPASYFLAYSYAYHCEGTGFANPFAGESYRWQGFIPGSMIPQSTSIDILKENHLMRINQMTEEGGGFASSYQQITSQTRLSKLSEINNVHILSRMIRIVLEYARHIRWIEIDSDSISSASESIVTIISDKMGGTYKNVELVLEQESANGAGRNRLKAKIVVLFKDMLKGISYEFYII